MNNSLFLYFAVFFASLSGLLSGFDTGVISGAMLFIKQSFETDSFLLGLLVSCVSLGAIFGALINGFLVDRLGRRKILILSALIFILGSIFSSISKNIFELILSRAFLGLAVGIVSFAGPLYLSEISSKTKRGAIVSFYQIALTFGILFSYLVNYFCVNFASSWRIMFLIGAIPAFILLLGMYFQKDTPRWYILKGDNKTAVQVLKTFDNSADIEAQIEEIKKTTESEQKLKFDRKLIMPFVVGIGIMFVQIATGINAIIYYAPSIFKLVGFSSNQDALFVTIFIGIINFLMTFVAFILVDKIGRKPLLYFGLLGMMSALLGLFLIFTFDFSAAKYLAVILCALYIVCFSMSLGPIGLLLISEVFPLKYRGSAMSIAIISNFIFNFMVVGLFPILLEALGASNTFLIFALICFMSILFVRFVVPETKGLTLEEIERKWS